MGNLLIKNARIPLSGNYTTEGNILISNGKIISITKDVQEVKALEFDEVLNASGLIATPGCIDIHAHIHDPEYLSHEDFRTGTIAAAYGSITTIYDMPLRMYVDSIDKLKVKVNAGLKESVVNFGIIAGMMNEDNADQIPKLRGEGVKAFKLFTCKPFRPRTDEGLCRVISEINRVGGVAIVHCEDDAIIDYLTNKFRRNGRADPLAHHLSRPAEAEASAIARVLSIAKVLNARVHIAHVSSALGARAVRLGKKVLGSKLTAETCPHYLIFTLNDVSRWGNYLKMNPSLKSKDDVRELWRALANGTIDAVTSDHAPSPRDEKETDVWSAWGGIPGIETMYPFIFTYGVKRSGLLSLERYVKVTSENPARILGLYPRKGSLHPGGDADISLIDPNLCIKVTADKLHHKVDWTPYEGMELCGWARYVIINGEVIIRDRELIQGVRTAQFITS